MNNRCPTCGFATCRWTGGTMGQITQLSADDWRSIYEFQRYVFLPFLHRMIARAREKKETDDDT